MWCPPPTRCPSKVEAYREKPSSRILSIYVPELEVDAMMVQFQQEKLQLAVVLMSMGALGIVTSKIIGATLGEIHMNTKQASLRIKEEGDGPSSQSRHHDAIDQGRFRLALKEKTLLHPSAFQLRRWGGSS